LGNYRVDSGGLGFQLPKTIHTQRHRTFCALLIAERVAAGLTQTVLARPASVSPAPPTSPNMRVATFWSTWTLPLLSASILASGRGIARPGKLFDGPSLGWGSVGCRGAPSHHPTCFPLWHIWRRRSLIGLPPGYVARSWIVVRLVFYCPSRWSRSRAQRVRSMHALRSPSPLRRDK
jgi:hypothetical protein